MSFKNILILIIIIIAGFFVYKKMFNSSSEVVFDHLNATYAIEGTSYTLKDGKLEQEIMPGSATKIKIVAWGKPAVGDLNNDGFDDAALLLVRDTGGSGTFFYVAVALKDPRTEQAIGINAVLLGDRVAPQNISVYQGRVELNYADRYPWEPFSIQPSVGKTKVLMVENNELKEISRPVLSQEIARDLIVQVWGGCTEDVCEELKVSVLDGKDGIWFVEAIYEGLRDDSVRVRKRIAWAHNINEDWELGVVIVDEYKCQPNRGHQDFSDELCL